MSSVNAVQTLTRYKAWANKTLFSKLFSTPDIEKIKDIQAIISTLNHAYVVDCIFKAHLEKVPHSFTDVNTSPLPSLSQLNNSFSAIDKWYVDYTDAISDSELYERLEFQFTSGEKASMLRSEIIFHVINHGTYHRGNVGVLLQQNSISPDKDVITDFLRSEYV